MSSLLLRLSTVMLSLGMLGAAACSACSPQAPDAKTSPAMSQPSYKCGANTHQVGNQCVGDSVSTKSAGPTPLNTSGNN